MIDVVFLLIIFFLCIEFRVLEAKLPAYLPKDKGSQSTQVEPMEQLSVGIYVESKGTPKYSACLSVSRVRLAPIFSRCRAATSSSSFLGST